MIAKKIEDLTALVVDTGLFLSMAHRLAEDMGTVLVWSPDQRGFPSLREGCIGDGFPDIHRVLDFWPHFDDIDLFVFPDIGHAGLQSHLRQMGKPVWGSHTGDSIELGRERFISFLSEMGLEVPEHTVCEGIDELREFLQDKEDYYIKISRWRRDMETQHWRNYAMDSGWIDGMAVSLGPLANRMRFLCFPAIETDLEIGADTYNIDGEWPTLMLNGVEGKDKTYFSAVTPTEKMPKQILTVIEAITDYLSQSSYRNQISFEIRVKDDKFYYIDATQRGGMPSSGSQHLLWDNFSQIVWEGAHGTMVNPEPNARYSIETMITAKREPDVWERVELPEELAKFARFNYCCMVDGLYCFPPSEYNSNDLGWLVATGDSPEEVIERQKDLADMLPDGLNADVESLASIIKEVQTMKKEGIPFTKQELPKPSIVL